MGMADIKRKSQVVLGPTMSQTQNALMQYEAGTTEVKQLQQELHEKLEQTAKTLPQDKLENALEFIETVEEYCAKLEQRGIKVDKDRFNSTISKAIETAVGDEHLYKKLVNIQRNLNEVISSEGVVYPKLTSMSSITGRITVREPALQNWPSALRQTLESTDPKKRYTFSLDFTAYDPTVLAVLSQDSNMVEDLKTDDFYTNLVTLMGIDHKLGNKEARSIVKNLFISVFINGADVESRLRKHGISQFRSEWNYLTDRYKQAHQYIHQVNADKTVTGLDGIERTFHSDDHAAFSKFIQAQAAYIFKHVFTEVQSGQHPEGHEVILPIHDALIIGAESEEEAQVVKKKMEDKFKEVTSTKLGRVKEELLGKKDDVHDMER